MNKKEKKEKLPTGWLCPRCGSVNGPQKDKCQCKGKLEEDKTEETQQLLQE